MSAITVCRTPADLLQGICHSGQTHHALSGMVVGQCRWMNVGDTLQELEVCGFETAKIDCHSPSFQFLRLVEEIPSACDIDVLQTATLKSDLGGGRCAYLCKATLDC